MANVLKMNVSCANNTIRQTSGISVPGRPGLTDDISGQEAVDREYQQRHHRLFNVRPSVPRDNPLLIFTKF